VAVSRGSRSERAVVDFDLLSEGFVQIRVANRSQMSGGSGEGVEGGLVALAPFFCALDGEGGVAQFSRYAVVGGALDKHGIADQFGCLRAAFR
jgi:hypothetical protein